jgi:uncharacterized protein YgfB (UPF0149 family)
MAPTEPLGYDELDAALVRLRVGADASELHGSLCGYLAGGGALDTQSLLAALQLDGSEAIVVGPQEQAMFEQLALQARDGLADPEFGFEPLLPADDRPLAERAESLAQWCRGFLGGFGLAGAGTHAQLSAEASEILRDLTAIAGAAFDFGDEAEDEDALIELHEFVRMGAALLFTEGHGAPPAAGDSLH